MSVMFQQLGQAAEKVASGVSRRRFFPLGALALLLGAAPVAAAAERPFHSEGLFHVVDVDGRLVTTMGTGMATHVGDFTGVNQGKVKPNGDTEALLVLEGANGDSIEILNVHSPVVVDGIPASEGFYMIVGGTGRFAGAGGSGTFLVTFEADGNHQVLDGTIDY